MWLFEFVEFLAFWCFLAHFWLFEIFTKSFLIFFNFNYSLFLNFSLEASMNDILNFLFYVFWVFWGYVLVLWISNKKNYFFFSSVYNLRWDRGPISLRKYNCSSQAQPSWPDHTLTYGTKVVKLDQSKRPMVT